MQWRRIVFSFVIVFGATLWALPFSVLATAPTFDLCYFGPSSGDKTCPPGTTYSSVDTATCITDRLWGGKYYEHNCLASVDPCSTAVGQCKTVVSCTSGFVATNCAGPCSSPTPIFCVDSAKFAAATILAGGSPVCDPLITPPTCATNPLNPVNVTTIVKNPLAFSTVEGVLGSVLSTLQAIIVVLALISIVIGGILYVTSAGDDERMKTAKGAITAAAIGLALGLAAPSFLKQIGDILGWGPVVPGAVVTGAKSLSAIALSALQFLLSIVGVLGIIMLVIGGLTYLTSAGNEEQSESGKKIVTYAIIGIAVALASLIAVTQIAGLFVP